MQPDDINLSDAILLALHERGWVKLDLRKGAAAQRAAPRGYTPTLPGVRYDPAKDRIKSELSRWVDGERVRVYIGSALPTWENEQRLSALWLEEDRKIPRVRAANE